MPHLTTIEWVLVICVLGPTALGLAFGLVALILSTVGVAFQRRRPPGV